MPSATTDRRQLQPVLGSSVHHQVAFCGPLGVGKTTAVRAASSTPVSGSEVRSMIIDSERTPQKRTTTVGIEYGEWHREGHRPVAIYGTPGQARFSEAREGALSHRAAIVLWLFGQNDYALGEAREWLDYLARDAAWDRLTVAVTRLEEPGDHPTLDAYRPLLDEYREGMPLVAADPRSADDVRAVILTALGTLGEAR